MVQTIVRPNTYMDSIFLMKTSKAVKALEGVSEAVVVMGTEINKSVLSEVGRLTPDAQAAGPGDLIVSLVVEGEEAVERVLRKIDELNAATAGASATAVQERRFTTIGQAADAYPDANLAVISVPGGYAFAEAKKALDRGLHAFVFSDNVPLEQEVELKRIAEEKGLFVMGPGCGNSVIGGVSLGLMSVVARGRIGIAGASGSGIHEIAALVTGSGQGISQAIGTGGRDLSAEVGGVTMIKALRYLEGDEGTDVIVLVSKPPHPETEQTIYKLVGACQKPVVIYFLGGDKEQIKAAGAYAPATLEQAAEMAVELARGEDITDRYSLVQMRDELAPIAREEQARLAEGQRYLRGLFCGGTHSEESTLILKEMLPRLSANIAFGGAQLLDDPNVSTGNCLVDMGGEEFTKGKPHPVMDPTILVERLEQEGADPETAVILFDLLLGYGAHWDPVGCIEATLGKIKADAEAAGRHVAMVASITGTDLDPQGLREQQRRLEAVGVRVVRSNAAAAMLAGMIADKGGNA